MHAYLSVDDLACDADQRAVRFALEQAPTEITEALNAFGFYEPRVATELDTGGECWQAAIRIEPGNPVLLRNVSIDISGAAATSDPMQNLIGRSGIAPGVPLNHGDFENLKRGLLDLARNRGYAQARLVESRIDIYPDELAADVTLRFESGPRYSIGEVTVSQDVLEPEFVNEFHELASGQPFDNRLLTNAFLDLTNSGYFSTVDVRALPADSATLTIPVHIQLTPAPRRIIGYGVGFATDTGPRLRFERSIRRFNRQGHQLTIDARVSPVISELTSTYRLPLNNPRFNWLNFTLGARREETDTSLARSVEAGARRVVDRPGGWSRSQFLSLIIEDFEVGVQSGRPHLLIPGIDWTRLRGDDALRPDAGSKLSFELRAADDSILSDSSFLQGISSVKWIRTIGQRNRILLRGHAGYLQEDDFNELPPSIRFFAGGDQSVRGFDYESLGPVDENGDVIGGTRLIELSAEFEHEIKPRWSLAVFADGGNAFNRTDLEMRTGAGFGARWRSPLGPIRIDVAWPVNDVLHGPRLHVSLGPDL